MFQQPKDAMYYSSQEDRQAADPDGKKNEYVNKLKEATKGTIDEQAKIFLRAFVVEFQGKFEQVLDMVEEFRTYVKDKDGQLDEMQAHVFLEKKGEAATALEFREKMRLIDLDFNKRVSILEWLLYRYKRTLKELFEAKPNAHLIKQLEEAIAKYQAVFKAKKEKEQKIADLEAQISQGGPGAAKAKSELARLKSEDPAKEGADEIGALASKLKAKRALKNPDEESKRQQEEAFKAEQARVAEEKGQKELEEKKKREDSKARLAARAQLFGK
jgi:hypothetical protein